MRLYKFRSLFNLERLADILVSERLFCPWYYDLNDPFEGSCIERGYPGTPENQGRRYNCTTTIDDLADPEHPAEYRVCSLSGSSNEVQMWSHYGDSHKGVAIEIDFTGVEPLLAKVDYVEGLKNYDSLIGENPSIRNILLHKTETWRYENEYRILTTERFYSIEGQITKILLGPRFPRQSRALIERLCPSGATIADTCLDHESATVKPQ